jgi:precorrin-8X/cobalt-precorrin-8 methylmutase
MSGSRGDYIRDGGEIYRRSFATIRAEADLTRFTAAEERAAVRVIHACGMVEIVRDIVFHPDFTSAASGALKSGAPILCDAKMAANGITRARLPAKNEIVCTLDHPDVLSIAEKIGNTRTAAALELWRPVLQGSVVVIGNAPTALFRLLEILDEGAPRPAAIIGMPVGFVGAAESKDALVEYGCVPYAIVRGRKGGSAMAAAALNAVASERE